MDPMELHVKHPESGDQCVVMPEGNDERVLLAARRIIDERVGRVVVLGAPDAVGGTANRHQVRLDGIEIVDPKSSDLSERYATAYAAQRPSSNPGIARQLMRRPLYFGAMMAHIGDADALLAGAANPTSRVIEAGKLVIGLAPGIRTPSSYFLMVIPRFRGHANAMFIFADCAVNIDPSPEQLADIALASASSARSLFDESPRVAMLSFSTQGSAQHAKVRQVQEAVSIAQTRAPELAIDGEFQADCALVPSVAELKWRGDSSVAGQANVLIFPDLNAGNIAYKLTQYLANARAVGPILQGFAKPISDLSRGASADDIVATAKVLLAAT